MKIAVEEHLKCTVFPRVGAAISKNGELLSTGYRGEIVGRHAERVAIEKLIGKELKGSTLFTTLEPCVNIHPEQLKSCAELIVDSNISEVVIGVLDPNGSIYSQGFRKLLDNQISVSFFNRKLRAAVEEETFEYGLFDRIFGGCKRRIPVIQSGTNLTVQFSKDDNRSIEFKFSTLQLVHNCVDLSAANGAVREAAGATKFGDITDPMVFRFPSHVSRMKRGTISIVQPAGATFFVLIKVLELYENDILFKCEVRNTP